MRVGLFERNAVLPVRPITRKESNGLAELFARELTAATGFAWLGRAGQPPARRRPCAVAVDRHRSADNVEIRTETLPP